MVEMSARIKTNVIKGKKEKGGASNWVGRRIGYERKSKIYSISDLHTIIKILAPDGRWEVKPH